MKLVGRLQSDRALSASDVLAIRAACLRGLAKEVPWVISLLLAVGKHELGRRRSQARRAVAFVSPNVTACAIRAWGAALVGVAGRLKCPRHSIAGLPGKRARVGVSLSVIGWLGQRTRLRGWFNRADLIPGCVKKIGSVGKEYRSGYSRKGNKISIKGQSPCWPGCEQQSSSLKSQCRFDCKFRQLVWAQGHRKSC